MSRLEEIILTMDVPINRQRDINWLSRNLGIRNSGHPDYIEAMALIRFSLRDDDRGIPTNYEKWRQWVHPPIAHYHADDKTPCYEDHYK